MLSGTLHKDGDNLHILSNHHLTFTIAAASLAFASPLLILPNGESKPIEKDSSAGGISPDIGLTLLTEAPDPKYIIDQLDANTSHISFDVNIDRSISPPTLDCGLCIARAVNQDNNKEGNQNEVKKVTPVGGNTVNHGKDNVGKPADGNKVAHKDDKVANQEESKEIEKFHYVIFIGDQVFGLSGSPISLDNQRKDNKNSIDINMVFVFRRAHHFAAAES